ncbi:MAG: tripartite tricarboxylate transporter permease [Oscillospiraceae bacterium]|nr:tripartite tricarboxylate transporter permease [Oscillospiraceae bacterium]
MDFSMILQAAAQTFTLYNIGLILGGLLIGMVIGCIPGLSVTLGIILMLPLTYSMSDAASAIILMLAVYVGGMYGGSISAITLNTPGTNSAIATTFDGYPLARKGKVKKALDVSLFASTFGGLFSALLLLLCAQLITKAVSKFTSVEYFALGIMGISLIAGVSGESLPKALISGMLGLMMACIGMDAVTGVSRYSFGSSILRYGIDILPAMIALIALTQVVDKLREFKISGGKIKDANKIDNDGMTGKEAKHILPACFRSSFIASVLGAMPGVGGGVAQFMCYNEVRRSSKHPEEFGKGSLEGIAAAESSNNAVVGSAMIPLLTLGIPGDGVTALLLGAFMLHGITPGPTMFTKQGVMAYTIILGCLVANIFLFPIGKALTRAVAKVIQVRYTYLACAIIMFCFAGSFAASGHYKELILTAAILIFSYILTILDIDNTPLLLGMILEPIMEKYFVSASMSYDRDYTIFVRRPISLVILLITVVMVFSMMRVNRRVNKLNAEQEAAMAAEHAEMGSAKDAFMATESAEAATEESYEAAYAGAVFESEHVKTNPDENNQKQ